MRLNFADGRRSFAYPVLGGAIVATACLTACTGGSNVATTVVPGSAGMLSITITVPASVSGSSSARRSPASVGASAKSAYVYAYPDALVKTPPPAALLSGIDISASSSNCTTGPNQRVCHVSVAEPSGTVVIHTDIYDATPAPKGLPPAGIKLAGAETLKTLTGQDSLALVTDGTVAAMTMTLSQQYLAAAQSFYVRVSALDAASNLITAPWQVAVFAPAGSVSAGAAAAATAIPIMADATALTDTSNGTASFGYGGGSFINPMTVVGIAGSFSQTAQIFPTTSSFVNPACPMTYPNGSPFTFPEPNVFPTPLSGSTTDAYRVNVQFGSSAVQSAQIDTGSELFIVSPSSVPKSDSVNVLGPGAPGQETLSSDNNAYVGHYYLARVTLPDIAQKTVPMEMLVEDTSCPSSGCYNLMGVGFGRPNSTVSSPGPTLKGPYVNTLLQLLPIVTSNTLVGGYKLTRSTLQAGLAASDTGEFSAANFQQLTPYPNNNGSPVTTPNRFGDWTSPNACFSFNGGACTMSALLVDVGIHYMILDGSGPFDTSATSMAVDFLGGNGQSAAPAAYSYTFAPTFTTGEGATPPPDLGTPPAPAYVNVRSNADANNMNTGIHALYSMHYLYDAVCGRAGFAAGT